MANDCKENEIQQDTGLIRLAEIYHLLKNRKLLRIKDVEIVTIIKKKLDNGVDINYTLPQRSYNGKQESQCLGFTLLHFAVYMNSLSVLIALLDLGADFTIKAKNGFTALHLAIEKVDKNENSLCLKKSFAEEILKRHVKMNNFDNPRCNIGISHFHIACMLNNTEAVEFFLKNGVSVNETINVDSETVAGFTPLHFAVTFCSVETTKLLLNYGADRHIQDTKLMKPIHYLIEFKLLIIGTMKKYETCSMKEDLEKINQIIQLLISTPENSSDSIDSFGFSTFHILCLEENITIVESFIKKMNDINIAIDFDSPVWPGYTPLHIAAHFNRIDIFVLLLKCGANIAAKDAQGLTPFDICLQKYDKDDWSQFISSDYIQNIRFTDNTKLADSISAYLNRSNSDFINFLNSKPDINSCIVTNSPIWPGYTLLHLYITFTQLRQNYLSLFKQRIIPVGKNFRRIVNRSQVINLARFNHPRASPLPMKSRYYINTLPIYKRYLHSEFLGVYVNSQNVLYDRINIVCKHSADSSIADVNGITPLHLAIQLCNNIIPEKYLPDHLLSTMRIHNFSVINSVLACGADPTVKYTNGLTPMQFAFAYSNKKQISLLLEQPKIKEKVMLEGLSNFHMACFVDNLTLVEHYLNIGADINSSVNCDDANLNVNASRLIINIGSSEILEYRDQLSKYANYTALHFAVENNSAELIKLLVRQGANIYLKNKEGLTPLLIALQKSLYEESRDILNPFIEKLLENDQEFNDGTGVTLLHVACAALDVSTTKDLLNSGVNVDAQIHFDSPILPGFTPLHVVKASTFNLHQHCHFYYPYEFEKVEQITKLLLQNRADITIKNSQNEIPIINICVSEDGNCSVVNFVTKIERLFNTNSVDDTDLTNFLEACKIQAPEEVEEYLKYGANVNQAVNYFSEYYPGYSPLHLAMAFNNTEVVKILLRYGADVNATDAKGSTALHVGIQYTYNNRSVIKSIETLLSTGKVDINHQDISGSSPIHLAMNHKNVEVGELLLKHEAYVNAIATDGSDPVLAGMECIKSTKDPIKKFELVFSNRKVDLNSQNIYGETPAKLLLRSLNDAAFRDWNGYYKLFKLFLLNGALDSILNCIFPESIIGILFKNFLRSRIGDFLVGNGEEFLEPSLCKTDGEVTLFVKSQGRPQFYEPIDVPALSILEEFVGINLLDLSTGRNVIQNLLSVSWDSSDVSLAYVRAIIKLEEIGNDFYHSDLKGKTALHIAVEYGNTSGVRALIKLGADVKAIDYEGKTPLDYCKYSNNTTINRLLSHHAFKMKLYGISLSDSDTFLYEFNHPNKCPFCNDQQSDGTTDAVLQLKQLDNHYIPGERIKLSDFVSRKIVDIYTFMPLSKRQNIDVYFQNFEYRIYELKELCPFFADLIVLQYRLGYRRAKFIDPAKDALEMLAGYGLPDPCTEGIIKFLSDNDLSNFIKLFPQRN